MEKKTPKVPRFTHTSKSKVGMGDYYGSGVKNPVGKIREGLGMKPVSKKGLKKPPKTLA